VTDSALTTSDSIALYVYGQPGTTGSAVFSSFTFTPLP
jgi:hypothetical protein